MVLKLPIPTTTEDTFIDLILSERTQEPNKSYFEGVAELWKSRISSYLSTCGNPELLPESFVAADDKNKYINLYKHPSDNSAQKPILDDLRNRELQLCPSCGEDGTPNTLDHYLPKESYPEYSILSKNLTPMCDICQGKKKAKVLNDDGRRNFIHPYYDTFLAQQVIELKIYEPFESPRNFIITAVSNLEGEVKSLVERHILELDINNRYSKYFRDQYVRMVRLINKIRSDQGDVLASLRLFKQNESYKALNSWGHVFYSSVLSNDDLIQYLISGDLPEHT